MNKEQLLKELDEEIARVEEVYRAPHLKTAIERVNCALQLTKVEGRIIGLKKAREIIVNQE